MVEWKNQDDLAESKRLSRESIRLEAEMRDKREEVKEEYQAKINAIEKKRCDLACKNT